MQVCMHACLHRSSVASARSLQAVPVLSRGFQAFRQTELPLSCSRLSKHGCRTICGGRFGVRGRPCSNVLASTSKPRMETATLKDVGQVELNHGTPQYCYVPLRKPRQHCRDQHHHQGGVKRRHIVTKWEQPQFPCRGPRPQSPWYNLGHFGPFRREQ